VSGRAEEIEIFVKVYDSNSLSTAASISGCTPSAVSRIVKRLEDRLGVQLFYRNSRSVRPTVEGDTFYRHCIDILKALDTAEAAVSDNADQAGVLRVNTLPTFAKYQLAPLMPEFHARYPRLRVEFILGARPADLLAQGIDVAVYSGPQPDSSLVARPLTTTRWVLVASPGYLAAHGTPDTPDQLPEHHCLNFSFPTGWNTWQFNDTELRTFHPQAIMSSDQGDMLLALSLADMGIVRLAEYHVYGHLREGRLVQVLKSHTATEEEPIYLLYRSRENLSPRVKVWIDFLKEKFGERPPWTETMDANGQTHPS
jgi:DNA-binding transcriptional LysR family regulator